MADNTGRGSISPLFAGGPDLLEALPFTGNDIIFPHGQPQVLQPSEGDITDLRSMVDITQRIHRLKHMPPHILFVEYTITFFGLFVTLSRRRNCDIIFCCSVFTQTG